MHRDEEKTPTKQREHSDKGPVQPKTKTDLKKSAAKGSCQGCELQFILHGLVLLRSQPGTVSQLGASGLINPSKVIQLLFVKDGRVTVSLCRLPWPCCKC